MRNLAIYGAGGLGREIAALVKLINSHESKWNFIGFFDDGKPKDFKNEYGKVLGDINDLNAWKDPIDIFLAIGSPKYLRKVSEEITNPLVEFPNLISPNTIVLDPNNFNIGKGNIICPLCSISCNVMIGDFNIFNWRISLGHDDQIGNYNVFMPGCLVSGEVTIGNENLFGGGSFIKQQIRIGNKTTLSPISALLSKPKSENLYIGNPAKIFKY